MRTLSFALSFASLTSLALLGAPTAFAQVSDAERAGARELFKQGDELQRGGHFAEALDKFQRAQQVFAAPTNLLRIAECDAALGRLVESAEAYREVVRTPLAPGAPPAFQAAVDQAKAELSQVEPRVPKLIVQVQPAGVHEPQMQIDGQNVPGALIGAPMQLDAGSHKVVVLAPGYSNTEQQVDLKERESKTVALTLNPITGITYSAGVGGPPVPPPPPEAYAGPQAAPPPPPPPEVAPPEPRRSNFGFLFGLHLGAEAVGGTVPTATNTAPVDASNVSSGGFAYGLDAGFRFARHFYVGLTLDHAALGSGNRTDLTGDEKASSSTTLLGVNLAFIGNPDRVSFYGELGVASRWFDVHETTIGGITRSHLYDASEFTLGAGVWIPIGHVVRLLPKGTLGLGSIGSENNDADLRYNSFAAFGMLALAGFYNLDL
jgi:PEGA domain